MADPYVPVVGDLVRVTFGSHAAKNYRTEQQRVTDVVDHGRFVGGCPIAVRLMPMQKDDTLIHGLVPLYRIVEANFRVQVGGGLVGHLSAPTRPEPRARESGVGKRVVVSGPRDWTARFVVKDTLARVNDKYPGVTFVAGGANGVDALVRDICQECGYPFEEYPARWRNEAGTFRPSAGHERNQRMLSLPNVVGHVAFRRPNYPWTPGTGDAVSRARRKGIRVWEREAKD